MLYCRPQLWWTFIRATAITVNILYISGDARTGSGGSAVVWGGYTKTWGPRQWHSLLNTGHTLANSKKNKTLCPIWDRATQIQTPVQINSVNLQALETYKQWPPHTEKHTHQEWQQTKTWDKSIMASWQHRLTLMGLILPNTHRWVHRKIFNLAKLTIALNMLQTVSVTDNTLLSMDF